MAHRAGQRKFMIGKKKYFFMGAILTLCIICSYFYFAFQHLEEFSVQEKFLGRKLIVDIIRESPEKWHTDDYMEFVAYAVGKIDEAPGTYAELFDQDFNSLSPRSLTFQGRPVRIENYPDLLSQIREHPSGIAVIPFARSDSAKPHDLHVYWCWLPADSGLGHRYVIVLGTSKYSLDVGYSQRLVYGAITLIIATAIFVIAALNSLFLCRDGDQ